jgi:anti-sigma regulatory factor (Ser/Thr protein kinase)
LARQSVAAVYPPLAASASHARELATAVCLEWGVEALRDDLALVVTELVANAIRHAKTDISLSLRLIGGGVRLEVRDGSVRPLRPRAAQESDEGGRGLLLVDALSHRYGVEAGPDGKRVWVELLLDSA